MNRPKRMLVVAGIVAAAVIVGTRYSATHDDLQGVTREVPPPKSAMSVPPPLASQSIPTPTPSFARIEPARINQPPLPIADEFSRTSDLKAFYDKYSGDFRAEATYFRARAYAICIDYVNSTAQEVEKRFAALGSPDHPEFRKRLEALRVFSSQCAGFYKSGNPDLTRMFAEAAAQGYPPAVAMTLMDMKAKGLDADSKAAELLQSNDPEVLDRVMPYLFMRSKLTLGDPNETPRPAIVADAWRLFACSIGADCTSTSRFLLERCWSDAICGASSVEGLFQGFKYSPSDYQELLKARALIESSIRQRNWRAIGLATR